MKDEVKKRDPTTGARFQEWKKGDSDILPITPQDPMQQVIRTGIESIRKAIGGRQSTYPNTPEGLRKFGEATEAYFQMIHDYNATLEPDARGVLPDVEGMCIFCGISRQTLSSYLKRGGQWESFILMVKDCIAAARKQAASDYKCPPVFEIFNLKCNFSYIERSELKLTTDAKTEEAEALQDAADEAGLIWDEQRHEYITVEGDAI